MYNGYVENAEEERSQKSDQELSPAENAEKARLEHTHMYEHSLLREAENSNNPEVYDIAYKEAHQRDQILCR